MKPKYRIIKKFEYDEFGKRRLIVVRVEVSDGRGWKCVRTFKTEREARNYIKEK